MAGDDETPRRKLTSREAILERAQERELGQREHSQTFRDEVLAALVEELHSQGVRTRELTSTIRELTFAVQKLTAVLEGAAQLS